MTNQEIVLIVYNTINIKGISYKLGYKDFDEIEQTIYDIILHYNNKKLNDINNNGFLLTFIYITIRNQIIYLKRKNNFVELKIELMDDDDENTKEDILKFIDDEFKYVSHQELIRMNFDDQTYYMKKLLFKNKILKKWTLDDMRDQFKISRNVINDTIQNTKKELRINYANRNKKEYDI